MKYNPKESEVEEEAKLIWLRAATRWTTVCAMLLTVVVFFYLGPRIEGSLFSPISHFEIVEIEPMEDRQATRLWGVMYKPPAKSHCEFLGLTITTTNHRDPDKIVQVEFEPSSDFVTRPPGAQEWGPWTIFRPEPPIGPFIIFRSLHRCHPLWNVETELYVGLTRDFFPGNLDGIEALQHERLQD